MITVILAACLVLLALNLAGNAAARREFKRIEKELRK